MRPCVRACVNRSPSSSAPATEETSADKEAATAPAKPAARGRRRGPAARQGGEDVPAVAEEASYENAEAGEQETGKMDGESAAAIDDENGFGVKRSLGNALSLTRTHACAHARMRAQTHAHIHKTNRTQGQTENAHETGALALAHTRAHTL
jgi:hypothetical protein